MKDIQLIIFDFDGTLCDSAGRIVETLQKTQRTLGYAVSGEEACRATIGLPLEKCFIEIIPGLSDEGAAECARTYRSIFEAANKISFPAIFPRVMETLEALSARGCRMAVASSRVHKSLALYCDAYGMTKLMELVIGSDDVERSKPDPEPVLYIMRKLGFDAEHTLVVGDMTYDILMGARAGAHTCGVTYGNGSREELAECGAETIIDRFDALLDIV